VDGATRATYEKIRRGSKFNDFMHNLKIISKNPSNSFFMVCVQKDNINELDNLVELAAKHHIPEVEFNPVGKEEFTIYSAPEAKESIRCAIKTAKKLGVKLTMSGSFGFPDIEKDVQTKLQGRCPRPWSYAYITYDGRLGPCNHRFNPPLVFADLKKMSFSDAWNSVGFQVFRKTVHTEHRFGKCNWCYENRYF